MVLINPNIATVQTSKHLGRSSPDIVYFLPITAAVVEDVLRKEQPDGCIVSMGGQTALNVGIELYRTGAFERHHCRVLGTAIEAIIATEDRQVFSERLQAIQESLAVSRSAHTIEEALQVAQEIKYPVLVRAGKPLLLRYSSYKLLLLQFCKLFYSYVTYFPVTRSLCSGRTGFRLR